MFTKDSWDILFKTFIWISTKLEQSFFFAVLLSTLAFKDKYYLVINSHEFLSYILLKLHVHVCDTKLP